MRGTGNLQFSRAIHDDRRLTHISADGKRPTMVDVGDKQPTKRTAWARALVDLPENVADALVTEELKENGEMISKKGPVFATATVAGVMAAKRTADLIPFCHPLPIEDCQVSIRLADEEDVDARTRPHCASATIIVDCRVSLTHKTGVEMEALTGASSAALCVYDMCKALSHDICIRDVRLMEKTGGKRRFSRDYDAS